MKKFKSLEKLSDLHSLGINLPKQRLVVVCAEDDEVLMAINDIMKNGNVSPILLGNISKIEEFIKCLNFDRNSFIIKDFPEAIDAAREAVRMIRDGEADLIMKGLLDTKVLLKEVVNSETGIKESKLLSHASLIAYPNLDRLIFATDCAMNINPGFDEKIAIINNVIELAIILGFEDPYVGIVSAVEKVNPKIASTMDAERLVEYFSKIVNLNFHIDGPFAIDNLISKEASIKKNIQSIVAGNADILLFPDLVSGNVFYKTSVFLSNAIAASIVLGAKCPIILTSRADSHEAKYYSIILGMVYAYGKTNIRN